MELKNESNYLADMAGRLRKALQRDPHNAWEYCNLGEALGKMGYPSQALEAMQCALHLAPDFVRAHRCLGEIYLRLGHTVRAAGSLRTALKLEEQAQRLAQSRRRAAQRLAPSASSGRFNQF
jgi:tetratricopeptide (TPR) repeat protein